MHLHKNLYFYFLCFLYKNTIQFNIIVYILVEDIEASRTAGQRIFLFLDEKCLFPLIVNVPSTANAKIQYMALILYLAHMLLFRMFLYCNFFRRIYFDKRSPAVHII